MNKEEILAMSRQENKNQDLYELQISEKSATVGALTGVIICTILFVFEIFVCGNTNFSLWGIMTGINAGVGIYKGIKLRKHSTLAMGIMYAAISLLMLTYSIYRLFATTTIL
ncbi:MAG: hypothetical protein IJZ95_02825 [Oscillospiraceae bacterium]|nr:hypothetical protein [Oscillospiraceae bacterium]